MIGLIPIAMERCVFPTPVGPRKTTFSVLCMMCSPYHLDTYNRDNILLKVYKGETRGGFTNLMCTPGDRVI